MPSAPCVSESPLSPEAGFNVEHGRKATAVPARDPGRSAPELPGRRKSRFEIKCERGDVSPGPWPAPRAPCPVPRARRRQQQVRHQASELSPVTVLSTELQRQTGDLRPSVSSSEHFPTTAPRRSGKSSPQLLPCSGPAAPRSLCVHMDPRVPVQPHEPTGHPALTAPAPPASCLGLSR